MHINRLHWKDVVILILKLSLPFRDLIWVFFFFWKLYRVCFQNFQSISIYRCAGSGGKKNKPHYKNLEGVLQGFQEGVLSETVIIVENRIGELSSNPGRDCVSRQANVLGKGKYSSLSSQLGVNQNRLFSLGKMTCLHHHHHHVALVARISLTLSRHSSLSFIALGRSSGQHPVSSHSCWMYVRAGRPAFARPCVGVHKSASLMSSSLLLQQCPACLVRLTWIVFVIGGRWPYSWCLGRVGLLIGPRALKTLNSIEKIQPRMMAATFNGNPRATIISCYSPYLS